MRMMHKVAPAAFCFGRLCSVLGAAAFVCLAGDGRLGLAVKPGRSLGGRRLAHIGMHIAEASIRFSFSLYPGSASFF